MKNMYMYSLTVMVATLLSLTACSDSKEQVTKTASHQVTYQIGMDADYPPYDFLDENSQPTGFEVELLNAIALNQGFHVKITPMPWNMLISGLDKKSYDLAIGGMSKADLEEKSHKYLLSDPCVYGMDSIAVLKKNTKPAPRSFNDLKDYKVATLADSSWVTDLKEISSLDNISAERTSFLALQKMIRGETDAMLNDRGVLKYYQKSISEHPTTLYTEGDYFEPYPMIFVANRDQKQLIKQINQGVKHLIKTGEYNKIYQKWFNEKPIKMPNAS